jgi:L-lactate dehydrogenase (cytochrome)
MRKIASWLETVDAALARWHLGGCHDIADLRRVAKRRLPGPMFHYMEGAADDEFTLKRNQADFSRHELVPRYLVDVSDIDPSTTVLDVPIGLPVILAPTGMSCLFHHAGERAVAAAAARAGTIYSLSTVSTISIEDIAGAADGPKWFQLYVFRDRTLMSELIDRCKTSGYEALCLTIDVPVPGNRERDLRTGMTVPPKLTLASWLDFAMHPVWSLNHLMASEFTMANVAHKAEAGGRDVNTLTSYIANQFDRSVTWDDAATMLEQWQGPFAVKGILNGDDARRAVDIGADAVVVSNHGGRQLDHAVSPIGVLAEIVDAVDGRAEVILDGGVRRGTDVLKAIGLGARACMIGRAYLYGLGAGGEAGVDKALSLLREEIVRDMALLGCRTVGEITASHVRTRTTD